ncbi:MAG TPA: response regulator [Ktedonobacteraceae bacterium]|nr:response regulator [Ktedonobacteraceae bacterium]
MSHTSENDALPIKILLVEDNPGDIRLTIEALKDCKIRNTLDSVEDGAEALAYLRKEGKYRNASTPDLILLDLDLPNLHGKEVLEQVKADVSLRSIPIIILTVSQSEQDVIRAYDLQASAYVTKPIDLDQFITVVHSIENFWFTIVKLPRR